MRRLKRDDSVGEPLGLCIRLRREGKQLTQAAVADLLGGNVPTISRLENGKRDLLVSELVEVGRVLGTRGSALLRSAEKRIGGGGTVGGPRGRAPGNQPKRSSNGSAKRRRRSRVVRHRHTISGHAPSA